MSRLGVQFENKIVFLWLAALIPRPGLSQEPPVFTTGTNTVLVDLSVTGDQSLTDHLKRENFNLFENGRPVTISGIAREELPMDVVLICQLPIRTQDTVWNNAGLAKDHRIGNEDTVTMRGGFA